MSDFNKTKTCFSLPENMFYLDGNSLGALPVGAADNVKNVMENQWGKNLITAWNADQWMAQPTRVGDRIGKLIGAPKGSVTLGDTLSIKVYQALASAIDLNSDRRVILSDSGNFPTDLYMAEGLIRSLDKGHVLKTPKPEDVEAMIDDSVAVLMLTEVDYRSGRMHDMKRLTEKAHAHGVITIWDLAHSAGALPVDLEGAKADFAVGCTYKYLNGGPGSPAFIYVCEKYLNTIRPALSGWLGHEAPFSFDLDYRPGGGIERMRVGTPPVLALAALEKALDIFDMVTMKDIRARSIELSELFIREVEARCPELELFSPRDAKTRGSQVSFSFGDGYAAMRAIIERGVVGDFRAPNVMRFGFTPLYIDEGDIMNAVAIIEDVMKNKLWDNPKYKIREAVT